MSEDNLVKSVNAGRMKVIDRIAQEKFGIPGVILMENAGIRAADIILAQPALKKHKNAVIFCGPGNNGGDGYVVARHLINNKVRVKIFVLVEKRKIKGDALINYLILKKMQASITNLTETTKESFLKKAAAALKKTNVVIDAIFGIGLQRDVEGIFARLIHMINASNAFVVSLDTPSGLCSTTGKVRKDCIRAHTTVTFAVAKKGFFKREGPKHVGRLVVADISIPRQLLTAYSSE